MIFFFFQKLITQPGHLESLEAVKSAMAADGEPRIVQCYVPPLLLTPPLKLPPATHDTEETELSHDITVRKDAPMMIPLDETPHVVTSVEDAHSSLSASSSSVNSTTIPLPLDYGATVGHKFHIRVMALVVRERKRYLLFY
jgi:hypothetical protein